LSCGPLKIPHREAPPCSKRLGFAAKVREDEQDAYFEGREGKDTLREFVVRDGIVTVTTRDGRTLAAEIKDSMLEAETLATTLLFELHAGK